LNREAYSTEENGRLNRNYLRKEVTLEPEEISKVVAYYITEINMACLSRGFGGARDRQATEIAL
jgi:hypothetical protein